MLLYVETLFVQFSVIPLVYTESTWYLTDCTIFCHIINKVFAISHKKLCIYIQLIFISQTSEQDPLSSLCSFKRDICKRDYGA